MADTRLTQETWGRVAYVEPTNSRVESFERESHYIETQSNVAILNPLEDYCIAVDLEVCIPDRRSCGFADETGEAIYMEFSSTKQTISFMNGTDGTLTTNFTDVSSLKPNDSTAECLGIESIDITYDSWLYPQVTIRFVDVRGAALMMPEEDSFQNKHDYIRSVYTSLFSVPYPVFKLKVKGFYGAGVTYYLCPEDTHIELDSSTGNFILTVKFIGQKFKIYADLPMTYICVAPYMTAGAEYWEKQTSEGGPFKFKNRDNTETPMMKFVELRRAVADAIHSEEQQKLAETKVKTENDYKKKEALLYDIKMCPISNWKYAADGRCYTIIKSAKDQAGGIASSIKSYLEKVTTYDTLFVKDGSPKIAPNFSCLEPYTSKSKIKEVRYKNGKTNDKFVKDGKNTEMVNYANDYAVEIAKQGSSRKESQFSLLVLDTDKNGISKLKDFIENRIPSEITATQKEREKVVSDLKKEQELSVEKALHFTPSIQNIFNLAFAHMDTFMYCFYQYMDTIKGKMDSRDVSRLINTFKSNVVANDVKTQTTGDLGNRGESLPPFPGFYKYADNDKTENGPMEQIWLEDLPGGSALDEVAFVNDLIAASKTYFNANKEIDELLAEYKKNEEEIEKNGEISTDVGSPQESNTVIESEPPKADVESPLTKIDRFIPITTYDLAKKNDIENPYAYISRKAYGESEDVVGSVGFDILTTFLVRALYYFSTNEVSNNVSTNSDRNKKMNKGDAAAFGDIEAVNFAKAIKENFAIPNLRSFILHYGRDMKDDGAAVLDYIIKGAYLTLKGKKTPVFSDNSDLVSFVFPEANDKAGDAPNKLPIGEGAISQFGGQLLAGKSTNYKYLPERESATVVPENLTFFIEKDKDYLSKIYANIRRVAAGISTDSEEDKKYKIKDLSIAKEVTNNISDVFRGESNIMNGVFCKRNSPNWKSQEGDLWKEIRSDIPNSTVDALAKKYAVKLPLKPTALTDGGNNNLFFQNTTDEALAYLVLLGLNTVTPCSGQKWQVCGIQYESVNGPTPKFALLKEGALYWREDYMNTHNGEDPIVHETFKDAEPTEMYSYMNVTSEVKRIDTADEFYDYIAKETCVGGIPLNTNNNLYYGKWFHGKNFTASRKKALIDMFLSWARTEGRDGVSLVTNKKLYKWTEESSISAKQDSLVEANPGTDKDDLVFVALDAYKKGELKRTVTPYLDLDYIDDNNEKSKQILGGNVDMGPVSNIKMKDIAERLQTFLMHTYFDVYTVFDLYAGRAPMKVNGKDDYSTCKFYAGKEPLKAALSAFMKGLARMYKEEIEDQFVQATIELEKKEVINQNDPFKNRDLRLATYQTLKALYDKWLCAPFHGEYTWKFLGPNVTQENSNELELRSEFTNFIYIDSFYRRIGRNLLTNVSTVADWIGKCLPSVGNETETSIAAANSKSVHDYLWGVAESVGGMLLQIPQSMAIKDKISVAEMFTPFSFNDDWQRDSTSFVFIYTYKPSEHLGTNQYPDDGFQLCPEIASLISTTQDGYQIPAFGVTYGKQNQSVFKNITLTTQSSNVTEAAIVSMMAIASKGSTGARESRFLGQDIYKVKTSYSYQCEFDMMGCGQIMPLMYFQLNNVPFWRGAYMVIKVKHQISQGDMTTHVTGVRINKYMLPWIEGELALADDYIPGEVNKVKTHNVSAQKAGTAKSAKLDVKGNSSLVLPTEVDVWTFKEGNISETKPIISVWPAHGPNTYKSCEWAWSSQLVDDYIIPILKVFDFADGTSFEDNIQRCNLNGAHTGTKGYSSEQTQNLVSKYGSKKVISLVPHWNALEDKGNPDLDGKLGQYFLVMPGWYRRGKKNDEVRRADSTKFAFYAAREAWKMIDRKAEFTKLPIDAIGALGGDRNKSTFPIDNGSVHIQTQMPSSTEDANGNKIYSEFGDPAYVPKCAAILTENWFRTYRPGDPTPDMPPSDKKTWDEHKTDYMALDSDGKHKTMQAWLWSEEGSTAVGYLNAMAIVNYIASLGENNAPTVNEKRLTALKKKKPYLAEKFRKWFSEANK